MSLKIQFKIVLVIISVIGCDISLVYLLSLGALSCLIVLVRVKRLNEQEVISKNCLPQELNLNSAKVQNLKTLSENKKNV